MLCFKGFGDLWTENRGAPKTPNPTTTDPTPHSRPTDFLVKLKVWGTMGVGAFSPLPTMHEPEPNRTGATLEQVEKQLASL